MTSYHICVVQFSSRESILVCTGTGETKTIKELLPDILKQIGPEHYGALTSMLGDMKPPKEAGAGEEDEDDDVPPLVDGTFDATAKK